MLENTVKPVLKFHSKIDKTKVRKTGGSLEHIKSIADSAILSTCIKRLSVLKTFYGSSFECLLQTGFNLSLAN